MGTYDLPRSVKGEGRILFIFSTKALIYTGIGAFLGIFIYFILQLFGLNLIGIIAVVIFGFIGFCIGTFKVPNTNSLYITKKTGGEAIDDVIKRWFLFKRKKNRIYVYEEETKDE